MTTQQTPVLIQLTDGQLKDVREILKESLEGTLGRLEQEATAAIQRLANEGAETLRRLESRALALSTGGDVLVKRREAADILSVSPATVDGERRAEKLPASPHWKGLYSLRTILRAYGLDITANDNARDVSGGE